MRGPQDLGGMMGFGAINPEKNEPVFHADWERRVLGFTVALGASGAWTIDQSRHQREKLPPKFYWSKSYYEIWFEALTHLLRTRNMVTDAEMASGKAMTPPLPPPRVLKRSEVAERLAQRFPYDRNVNLPAAFKIGDGVMTKALSTPGHTRLPHYAWRKRGVITAWHGTHVYPDSNGMGHGEDPQHLYTVRFTAEEIWGKPSPDSLYLDLWEPYLERAP